MRLAYRDTGGEGPPLLVLHGFMGSTGAMAGLVDALSLDRRVVAVDLIGHGASPAPRELAPYRTDAMVQQVREVLDEVGLGVVDAVGYSMGARLALSIVASTPALVRRLALISGTPGIADDADRESRIGDDAGLADSLERDGLEAFVDRWEQFPMFASQRQLPSAVQESIRAGRLAQREGGLANSLRGFGTGSMPPLWEGLGRIATPTLAIAGELDPKYAAIAGKLEEAMPAARAKVIASVGHATHIENPSATIDALRDHFDQ
ncbi:MAG: 2-succinyl-6-hydroxy-2,4-cyclohexadiene-1-carboxylate synthase [Acidimicrobiales bacterium]